MSYNCIELVLSPNLGVLGTLSSSLFYNDDHDYFLHPERMRLGRRVFPAMAGDALAAAIAFYDSARSNMSFRPLAALQGY